VFQRFSASLVLVGDVHGVSVLRRHAVRGTCTTSTIPVPSIKKIINFGFFVFIKSFAKVENFIVEPFEARIYKANIPCTATFLATTCYVLSCQDFFQQKLSQLIGNENLLTSVVLFSVPEMVGKDVFHTYSCHPDHQKQPMVGMVGMVGMLFSVQYLLLVNSTV
jgi:hypothetical protein